MVRAALINFFGILPWANAVLLGSVMAELFGNNSFGVSVMFFCIGALATWLLTIAALGRIFSGKIKPIKVARDLQEDDYFYRAAYGRTWTTLFYFKSLYSLVLGNIWLRNFIFRSFGYQGNLKFTVFPDTWIRDLPLLDLDKGAYVANRATLGTNICLKDNSTVVGRISLGKGALVGHLSIVGLGTTLEENSEIGVNAVVGIRSKIGANTVVGGRAVINHGVKVGGDCVIGPNSYLGIRSVIAPGLNLPAATIVPEGKIIGSQEDVDKLISSEKILLDSEKSRIEELLAKYNKHL